MDLKEALTLKDKIIVGSERTLKAIQDGKIKEVFISSNFPENKISEIENAAEVWEFKINKLKISSEELGARCRRPHSVIMLGLIK